MSRGVDERRVTWKEVQRAITRPYPVTAPMVLLVSLVPFYLVMAAYARGSVAHVPELALDRLLPVVPAWAFVYGALYAFLILVPVFVVQQPEMIRRTVWAYITVWSVSYVVFWAYPTTAHRPEHVPGDDFAAWGLRFLYDADPPYNCFPSIHVAHSGVSALAVVRVHRGLGIVAVSSAALVALATLLTKQHYIVDVVAGAALAGASVAVWFRAFPSATIPDRDRRLAPALALVAVVIVAAGMGVYWVAYWLGTPR
jgi:membrane-associated phospholipid phosphatase